MAAGRTARTVHRHTDCHSASLTAATGGSVYNNSYTPSSRRGTVRVYECACDRLCVCMYMCLRVCVRVKRQEIYSPYNLHSPLSDLLHSLQAEPCDVIHVEPTTNTQRRPVTCHLRPLPANTPHLHSHPSPLHPSHTFSHYLSCCKG